MRNPLIYLFTVVVLIISSFKTKVDYNQYEITKIDSINSYYLIIATHEDSLYKIVSQKEKMLDCHKIEVGKQYSISLKSVFPNKVLIGTKTIETPYNVNCIRFDDSTTICINRDNGINKLYMTPDLIGLCIKKTK